MATFYTGYRNVLKGRSTTNAIDPYTGAVAEQGRYYNLLSPDQVFDGMPDNVYNPNTYYKAYGNARVDQSLFSPMKDPGDRAGTALQTYDFKGVPGAKVLSGTDGWITTAPNHYEYFGHTGVKELEDIQTTEAPEINYYGDYIVTSPLADAEVPSNLDTDYDHFTWQGVPSSKALDV